MYIIILGFFSPYFKKIRSKSEKVSLVTSGALAIKMDTTCPRHINTSGRNNVLNNQTDDKTCA